MEIICSEQDPKEQLSLCIKTEDVAQGGRTFIFQSGTMVLKMPHLTFLICAHKKGGKMKKRMKMFDKLLSRQKQERDGGGRC